MFRDGVTPTGRPVSAFAGLRFSPHREPSQDDLLADPRRRDFDLEEEDRYLHSAAPTATRRPMYEMEEEEDELYERRRRGLEVAAHPAQQVARRPEPSRGMLLDDRRRELIQEDEARGFSGGRPVRPSSPTQQLVASRGMALQGRNTAASAEARRGVEQREMMAATTVGSFGPRDGVRQRGGSVEGPLRFMAPDEPVVFRGGRGMADRQLWAGEEAVTRDQDRERDLLERELRSNRTLLAQREPDLRLAPRREAVTSNNPFVREPSAEPKRIIAEPAQERPVAVTRQAPESHRVVKKRGREEEEEEEQLALEKQKRKRLVQPAERRVWEDDRDRLPIDDVPPIAARQREAGGVFASTDRQLSRPMERQQADRFPEDPSLARRVNPFAEEAPRLARTRRMDPEDLPTARTGGIARGSISDEHIPSRGPHIYDEDRINSADANRPLRRDTAPALVRPAGAGRVVELERPGRHSARDVSPPDVPRDPRTAFAWDDELPLRAVRPREPEPPKPKIQEIKWDKEETATASKRSEAAPPKKLGDSAGDAFRGVERPVAEKPKPRVDPAPFSFTDVTTKRKVALEETKEFSKAAATVVSKEVAEEEAPRLQRGRGAFRSAPSPEATAAAARPSTTQGLQLPPPLESLPAGWRECIDRATLQVIYLDHKRHRTTQENPWEAEVRATQETPPTDPQLVPILQECRDAPADALAGAMRTRLSTPTATALPFRRLGTEDVRSVLRALVSIRQHYLFHDTPARRQDFRVVPEVQVLRADPIETSVALTIRRMPFSEACRQRYSALRWTHELPSAASLQVSDTTEVQDLAQQVIKLIPAQQSAKLWAIDRAELLDRAVRVVAEAGALLQMEGAAGPLQFAAYKRCQTDPPIYEFEVTCLQEEEEEAEGEEAAATPPTM